MTGRSAFVKRLLGFGLAAIMLVTLALPALAQPAPASEYAVLIDSATGQVLYEKNMEESISPSGLVKLMTALVAVESGTPLSNNVTVSSDALDPLGSGYRGISLVAGEQLTLEACLQGMLLDSANDAANVIADVLGGDIDTFVKNMNDTAASLGLEDTTFVNAHGLSDPGQETTVYDMALILRHALSNPDFAELFGTQEATIPATNYTTESRELITRCRMNRNNSDYSFEGSIGGTVGYGSESGWIIATAAVRDGRTLIAVAAKSESEDQLYSDASTLLEYGFDGFTEHTFSGSEFSSGELPLTDGGVKVGTAVFTVALDTIKVLLPADSDPDKVVVVADSMPSAVEKDSAMDFTADLCYHNENGEDEVLIPDLLLTADITLDSVQTDVPDSTENTGTIATDDDGNPVTDADGNVITGTAPEDPEGNEGKGGFKKFLLTLLKVILIIIAILAGLVLLGILGLVILKQVRRAKKRKARARAAAERAARAQQRQQQNSDRDFF